VDGYSLRLSSGPTATSQPPHSYEGPRISREKYRYFIEGPEGPPHWAKLRRANSSVKKTLWRSPSAPKSLYFSNSLPSCRPQALSAALCHRRLSPELQGRGTSSLTLLFPHFLLGGAAPWQTDLLGLQTSGVARGPKSIFHSSLTLKHPF
jgi:hypothetical protein